LLVAEFDCCGGVGCDGGAGGECGAAGFDGLAHGVGLDVTEDGGLDAAEGEVEGRCVGGRCGGFFVGHRDAFAVGAGFDLAEGEGHGARVAVGGEGVDPWAAGVTEAEEFGDLVVGFAGGVVYGAAYVAVGPRGFASLSG
jgi:hypothetical protein